MKEVNITIRLYEKGDRVLTPEGIGTVLEDEKIELNKHGLVDRLSFAYNDVPIELDEACSSWSGRKGRMETSHMMPSGKTS